MEVKTKSTAKIFNRFEQFIVNGGPEVWEYQELDYLIDDFSICVKEGRISENEVEILRRKFGEAFSNETLQGFAYNKPYGYSGDFEIIERVYDNYVSSKKSLEKWDFYLQNQPAARAVRNRKAFFKAQLAEIFPSGKGEILNLASGPCTELKEYFDENPDTQLFFDCLDMDKNAIEYAQKKLEKHLDKVTFINQNLLRFSPEKEYDLIWSAGLFDYFNDYAFVKILKIMKKGLKPNGVVLIGNFDVSNKTKNYMEMLDWNLKHRSASQLIELGRQAFGEEEYEISVLSEREKVNLFLKVRKRT